jgi:Tol biopolymer transport system component
VETRTIEQTPDGFETDQTSRSSTADGPFARQVPPGGTGVIDSGFSVGGSGGRSPMRDSRGEVSGGGGRNEEWVAYFSDADGSWSTYVMRGDGSQVTRVPGRGDRQVAPDWSPDGGALALIDGDDLVITAIDGSHRQVVAPGTSSRSFSSPAWSPGGDQIVVTACPSRSYCSGELWLFDLRNGTGRYLADGQGAAWHPDGRHIVFVEVVNAESCRGGMTVAGTTVLQGAYCHGELHVLDVVTGRVRPVGEFGHHPRYSPDGQTLVWERYVGSENGIDVVVAPAEDPRRMRSLTAAGDDMAPSWTADGRLVFYKISPGDRSSTIWVMDGDGSDARALQPTTTLGWNLSPRMTLRQRS